MMQLVKHLLANIHQRGEGQCTWERTTASHSFANVSGSTGSIWVFFPLYSQLCPPKVSSSTSHGSTSNLTPAGSHIVLVSEAKQSIPTATAALGHDQMSGEVQDTPEFRNKTAHELAS